MALRRLLTTDGVQVMSAPPGSERWQLLMKADWQSFFAHSPKTFREERWWVSLLMSNRRVFLFHAVSFGVCIISCRSSRNNHLFWPITTNS